MTAPISTRPHNAHPAAVVQSTLAPESVLTLVCSAYGLAEPVECVLLHCGLNDRYLLTTREERLLVRICGAGRHSISEINYELELLGHLAFKGVPVAAPLRAKDGGWTLAVSAPEGIRRLAVFLDLPGVPFVWQNEEHGYLAGRLAAAVHAGSEGFVSRHRPAALDLGDLLGTSLAAMRPFVVHRPEDCDYLERFVARLRERAAELIASGLEGGICCGPTNHSDLRLSPARQLSLLELEECGPGWRAFDLVSLEQWWGSEIRGPLWEAFLQGYSEGRPLAATDHAALPVLHAISRLWRLGRQARYAPYWGDAYLSDMHLSGYLRFFQAWETEHLPVGGERRPPAASIENRPRPAEIGHESPVRAGALSLVMRSLLSPETVAAAVERAYAIETPLHCRLVQRGANDTYLLIATTTHYIARVYGARARSASEISYELELLTHLAARQVPVIAPLRARDGGFAVPLPAPEGPRQMALFPYAEGPPSSWKDQRQAVLGGRLAARIHAAAADFASPHARFRWDLEYLVDRPLEAIRPFLAHRPDDCAYLERLGDRVRERAQAFADAGLSWGPCHGDFNSNNIRVTEDGALVVFDFDLCGPGWQALDCLYAHSRARDCHEPAIWEAFSQGYREIRPLQAADVAALPLLRGLFTFWLLGTAARGVAMWGASALDDVRLDRRLRRLRQWEAEEFHNAAEIFE